MGTYSSGEDLLIKTRKPYTITKQRERWTEEEHNRFLEALKLYGRAWQRIEEHIGTKTAVQIRSHAQKFFSKLEKEAVAKGLPTGDLEIDIPPPRPKRKPNNPYPRKTGVSPTTCHVAQKDGKLPSPISLPRSKQLLDLEKEPLPEKPIAEDDPLVNAKGKEFNSSSEVLTVLQDAHCSAVSSMNKSCLPSLEALRNPCSFREFIPPPKNGVRQDASTESYVTNALEENQKPTEAKQTVKDNGPSNASKSGSCNASPTDEMEGVQNYPRHIPVHVVDGCFRQTPSDVTFQEPRFHPVGEVNGHPCVNSTSATAEHPNNEPRSSAQSFLNFPSPLISAHHISSAFSNLIVSTLLQNPAAHAAATFAATFWPYANVETNGDSPVCAQGGGFFPRQANSAPSMAAIAAATVAAATAWWAAHGLLPLCAPAFACPLNSAPVTPTNADQVPVIKTDGNETARDDSPLQDLTKSEAAPAVNSTSKSLTLSLSDSEESGCPKKDTGQEATDHGKVEAGTEIHDLGKTDNRKQVDRSSCGSNTSGSEAETDALEKLQKDKEEFKEADASLAATESNNSRRSRSSSNISDPRKGVSEEGRLAFQALFSREKLPQSFSPLHDQNADIEVDKQNNDNDETASPLNLNSATWLYCNKTEAGNCTLLVTGNCTLPTLDCTNNEEEEMLTIGLGHGKFKARRAGFKPYKRCSVEAKENRMVTAFIQGEEKCPKRLRVEGEPAA